MQKQQLLYKGKAKSVYETEDHDLLILHEGVPVRSSLCGKNAQ